MEAALDTSTPVTTSETTTATPATQETSAQSPTSERPTTVQQLSQFMERQDQAGAADPTPPAAKTETAAIVPPAETKPDGAINPSEPKGPIPFEVHKTALDNARTKAVADFRQTAGIDDAVRMSQRINTDAPGFWRDYTTELLAHPTHGPAVRSDLARMFGGLRNPSQAPAVDLSPDVQITDAEGKVVGATFSADRVSAIVAKAVQDAIAKEVAPLKQESAKARAEREAADFSTKAAAHADSTLVDVLDILEISDATSADAKKLLAAVNALMAQDARLPPEKAARQVFKTHVRPTLEGKAQQATLDKLQQKAAGNTASSGGAGTPPKRPTNPKELAKWMSDRASA